MIFSSVQVWGDSLARGIVFSQEKGRYMISRQRAAQRLQEELGAHVTNHSVMGATSVDGLRAFQKSEAVPGALMAIEYGGNDCDLDWPQVAAEPDAEITAKVPLEEFGQTLKAFVTLARAREMTPLLVTPLPLHAQRYFDWVTRGLDRGAVLRALGDVQHIYRWQERYAIAVERLARELTCPVFDARDVLLSQRRYDTLMSLDGIHPNDEGHRLIADAAIAFAENMGFPFGTHPAVPQVNS